jgi:hypothetical protein
MNITEWILTGCIVACIVLIAIGPDWFVALMMGGAA